MDDSSDWASKNHFQILGLTPDVDDDGIVRKAYYKMSRAHHPDKATTEEERQIASKRQTLINQAFDALKDSGSRKRYHDELLNPQLADSMKNARTLVFELTKKVDLFDEVKLKQHTEAWVKRLHLTPGSFKAKRVHLHTEEARQGFKTFPIVRLMMSYRFLIKATVIDADGAKTSRNIALTFDNEPVVIPMKSGPTDVHTVFPSYPYVGEDEDDYPEYLQSTMVLTEQVNGLLFDPKQYEGDMREMPEMGEMEAPDMDDLVFMLTALRLKFAQGKEVKKKAKAAGREFFESRGLTVAELSLTEDPVYTEEHSGEVDMIQYRVPVAYMPYEFRKKRNKPGERFIVVVNMATGEFCGDHPLSTFKQAGLMLGIGAAGVALLPLALGVSAIGKRLEKRAQAQEAGGEEDSGPSPEQ
ncbi:Co-chaperone protein HscB [Carpediemonas membranifera]|uniref:Co-chaperone protein HscB n=1 Tax=Carpediemonas membranifera TaxID=201153 RepID=A0A8J6DYX3_9EUKA|nr:Co-chaperone protein HscB [Carpediemonas membranifera]|eukprot:KAG9392844.1 Co-chaperone protein HscB [Carpediemonas membranifera]